jgi:acetyl esterase/lipase
MGVAMKRVITGLVASALAAVGVSAATAQRDMAAAQARARRAAAAPMAPVPPPPGTRIERDIAYGSDPAQRLDLYRPAQAANAPILLMVHGGGWMRGDKGANRVVDNKVVHWIPKGFILVSADYRMVPQVGPLDEADDIAKALAFVQANARDWGGDPARIVLMGHSAGAHLVALLAASPEIVARADAKPWLGTIALDSAAYDIAQLMQRPHFPLYDRVFRSDEQAWRAVSPTVQLKTTPAPMLLVCSTKRADSCPAAEDFAAKARSLHGRVTILPVDMTHADINGLVGTGGDYTAAIDSFMTSIGLN